MIKNTNEILAQNVEKSERILMEFMQDILELDESGNLTINTVEKRMGILIATLIKLCCSMAGSLLSNIVPTEVETHCNCGKKLVNTKHNAKTKILSMFGYIPITRDTLFCRRCRKGYGICVKSYSQMLCRFWIFIISVRMYTIIQKLFTLKMKLPERVL